MYGFLTKIINIDERKIGLVVYEGDYRNTMSHLPLWKIGESLRFLKYPQLVEVSPLLSLTTNTVQTKECSVISTDLDN